MALASTAKVSELRIYPIKGLCPIIVDSLEVLDKGRGIRHDRAFAMFTRERMYVNGKSNPRVHRIRLENFEAPATVTLWSLDDKMGSASSVTFDLTIEAELEQAEHWLQTHLHVQGLRLMKASDAANFCDDPRFDGPSIVSQATLQAVAGWFEESESTQFVASVADRYRPNIVVSGVPAFWEDALIDPRESHGIPITIGDSGASVIGVYPIHRCVVPSREPSTSTAGSATAGHVTPHFAKKFQDHRKTTETLTNPTTAARFSNARPPLETAFLCTATSVLFPGHIARGDTVQTLPSAIEIQPSIRRVRDIDSAALQALINGARSLREIPSGLHRSLSLLITVLPSELSYALVTKQMPSCFPKPTSSEMAVGWGKLAVGIGALTMSAMFVLKRLGSQQQY